MVHLHFISSKEKRKQQLVFSILMFNRFLKEHTYLVGLPLMRQILPEYFNNFVNRALFIGLMHYHKLFMFRFIVILLVIFRMQRKFPCMDQGLTCLVVYLTHLYGYSTTNELLAMNKGGGERRSTIIKIGGKDKVEVSLKSLRPIDHILQA